MGGSTSSTGCRPEHLGPGCPGSRAASGSSLCPSPWGQVWGRQVSQGGNEGPRAGRGEQEAPQVPPPYQESPGDKRDNSSLAPARSPRPAERVVHRRPSDRPPGRDPGGSRGGGEPRAAAGTWAQASGGQCWVQTVLPPRQRQLAQASCHSDPGWGQWEGGTPVSTSVSAPAGSLQCRPAPNPAWGPSQGKELQLAVGTRISGGRWALGAQSRGEREAGLRRARWHGGARVSHRVGTPVAPALAAVCGHAGACQAAEAAAPAHAASGLPRTAVALGLGGIGLLARRLAGPRLPRGQLLPHFPRGALCQGRPPTPPLESVPGPACVLPPSTLGSPSPLPSTVYLAPAASGLLRLQTHLSALIHPPKYFWRPAPVSPPPGSLP